MKVTDYINDGLDIYFWRLEFLQDAIGGSTRDIPGTTAGIYGQATAVHADGTVIRKFRGEYVLWWE